MTTLIIASFVTVVNATLVGAGREDVASGRKQQANIDERINVSKERGLFSFSPNFIFQI